jgi:hypothetical protein
MAQSSFESSKKQFIETVCGGYEKFLIDTGVNLEHLLEDIRNRRKNEKEKCRLEMLEFASNKLFDLEAQFTDKIQAYYGDLCDLEIISEWYYDDSCIIMEFMWNNKTLQIINLDGKLKIRGGLKKLRMFIKSDKDLIYDFIEVSNKYYELSENYYTVDAKYSE